MSAPGRSLALIPERESAQGPASAHGHCDAFLPQRKARRVTE